MDEWPSIFTASTDAIVSFIERLTGNQLPVQMNKDEEIKHLTALNERNHNQITELNTKVQYGIDLVGHQREQIEDLSRQLKAAREKWNEDKNALDSLYRRFERLMLERDNLDGQNMQLQNMLYGVIGMLSEQNAETVLSQLDKLQRALMG